MEGITQSIEEALENHPGFSKKAPQPYDKSEPLRNEISYHPEVGMVVINAQKIRILDVNTDKYITLNPSCKIHPMHGGIINASGNLLAIQGNNQILLIALSEEAKLSIEQKRECNDDEIRCKSQVIQLGPIHNNEVRKISWHPLSDTHLVILTNDSLRLYNCHVSTTEPEQNFYLTDALDPISFSFGGSTFLDSWQRFTIFLLMRSGHIHAICPVVPFDCMIPVEYLSMLQDQMRSKDDDYAIRWLKEIKGPNIKVDFKSPLGIKRVNKRGNSRFSPATPSKTRKVFSANFESDDDSSVEEEPEEQEKGFIRTKKPHSFNNLLVVQGPLTEHGSTSKFECTDILSLPTMPTVIMRAFEDAVIEVFLLFEDVQPKWGRDKALFKKQRDQPSLMLYDNIDLGLPTYNSEMGPCRFFIAPNNSANNYEFYAYHGAGVHRVKLAYMSLLSDSALMDPSRLEKESIPPSEKSWIINTLPIGTGTGSRPVVFVGFTVVTVKGKTFIVARDAEANLHCASDGIAQIQKRFLNNLSDNISQHNKGMSIEFPQKVTKVSNLHFEKESQAIGYLILQTEERMKNQLPALHRIELQLKDQLKSLTDSYKEQQSIFASSYDKKAVIAERFEKIQEKIVEVQQVQKDLIERLNRAMNTTLLLQKNLTKAEMKFHEELIGLKQQTCNQEQEVKLLKEQLEGLDFKENVKDEQVVAAKERKMIKIIPILEQEADLLNDLTQQTQDLQSEVLKLYGLSVL